MSTLTPALLRSLTSLFRQREHWRVQLSPAETVEYLTATRPYGSAAISLVGRVNEKLGPEAYRPAFAGNTYHTFEVGREYSPVLYFRVVQAYLPDDYDYAALAAQLEQWGKDANADECGVAEDRASFVYRWWWD